MKTTKKADQLFGKRYMVFVATLLAMIALLAVPSQSQGSDEPYHVVLPVQTRVIAGNGKDSANQYSVVVNGLNYTCPDGSLSGFNIVAFDRKPGTDTNGRPTLNLYKYTCIHTDTGQGLGPVKQYLDELLSSDAPADLLVIVSSLVQDLGATSEIAPELEKFGATREFESIGYPQFTFSFLGIKNAKIGEGYQVGGDGVFKGNTHPWSLNGYLAMDSSRKWAFFQPDYVQFELSPGSGDIKIGNHDYANPDGTTSGIRVLAVDRANPEIKYSDNVYPVGELPADLGHNGEGYLYFVVSVRQPFSSPGSKAQARDALSLENIGGTYELYANAGTSDIYCLVGAASPGGGLPPYQAAEEGSLEPDHPTGPLRGALGRGRRGNFYSPVASASGQSNFDFYSILAQAPVPFPVPDTPDQQTAFDFIGTFLCGKGCNPRDDYWNTNISIESWQTILASKNVDPSNPSVNCDAPGAPRTPYCVVRAQLLTEFTDVAHIRNLSGNILMLWSANQANNIYSMLSIEREIQQEVKANVKARTKGIVEKLLELFLKAGSYLPKVFPPFGIASTVFSFSQSLANNPAGDSEVSGVSRTVAGLQDQATASFTAQLATVGTMFRFIYQDCGKIQALGSALSSGSEMWKWDDGTTTSQLLDRMNRATKVSYYQSILPTLYALGQINNLYDTNPADYHDGYFPDYPLGYCHRTTPFRLFQPAQYVSSREIGKQDLWHVEPLGLINQGGGDRSCYSDYRALTNGTYKSLDPKILDKIFNDLKVYQPDFYRHWDFPRVTCDILGSSTLDLNNFHSTGCKWRKASFRVETESAVSAANSQPEEFESAVSAPSTTQSSEIKAEAVTFPEAAASSLSYSWQVLGGNATIFDGDTATPTIYLTSGAGSYVVRVTMTDAAGNSWQSETTVNYQSQP